MIANFQISHSGRGCVPWQVRPCAAANLRRCKVRKRIPIALSNGSGIGKRHENVDEVRQHLHRQAREKHLLGV
jgi:hypothetical protein